MYIYIKYMYIYVHICTYVEITAILGDNRAILGTPYLRFCKAVCAQIDYLMHLES